MVIVELLVCLHGAFKLHNPCLLVNFSVLTCMRNNDLKTLPKPAAVGQIQKGLSLHTEMVWVELGAGDAIILENSQDFAGFGQKLRAEEGSIFFHKFAIAAFVQDHGLPLHQLANIERIVTAKRLFQELLQVVHSSSLPVEIDFSVSALAIKVLLFANGASDGTPFVEADTEIASGFQKVEVFVLTFVVGKFKNHGDMVESATSQSPGYEATSMGSSEQKNVTGISRPQELLFTNVIIGPRHFQPFGASLMAVALAGLDVELDLLYPLLGLTARFSPELEDPIVNADEL